MTKRKRNQVCDAPNLKRFRSEIQSITNSRRHFTRPTPKLTRKQKRKEARLEKKSRKNAYHQGLPMPSKEQHEKEKAAQVKKSKEEARIKKLELQKEKKKARKERKKQEELEEKQERRRVETMYDDKEIKDLEKKLGLNKRKKKDTLPMSFKADGLDYILDAVDTEKLQAMADIQNEEDDEGDDFGLMDDGSEDDSDVDDFDEALDDSDDSSNHDSESTKETSVKNKEKTKENTMKNAVQNKAKWEELADKIKEIAEKKKLVKKSVTFADESEGDDSDNEFDDGDNDDDDDDDEYQSEDENSNDDDVDDNGDDENDDDDDNDFDNFADSNSDEGDNDFGDSEGVDDDNTDAPKVRMNLVDTETGDPDLKEDIYGRLRDAKGNVVVDNKPVSGDGAYVPPARRLQMAGSGDEKKRFQIERLQKQMKGLVNRASENNMQPITGSIEEMYLHNSRADVNETLVGLIADACITPTLTPDRLSMELMMLVAILHGNVGSEVGAAFLQHFAKRFGELLKERDYGVGKLMDNVVVLIAHLYNFKVVHSVLVFDVLTKLTDHFTEKDIELILLLLRHVGFSLRKDNPMELKDFIVKVQSRATSTDTASLADQSRVRFMLEVIMAIRNNNMRKIPNYDPEHLDHLRKLIRNYIRGGQFGDNQLHITLEDLFNADTKGKWWLVGSAWDGKSQQNRADGTGNTSSVVGQLEISSKLQELARKQRMNTDLRRNIFFVIMTSEDYLDAFEKLLRLGLKSSQQQEIILVILDCCLQEKKYNPFYSHLGQKFCEHHRTFQMGFQFCVWDRFKEIKSLSDTNRHHLAKLLEHLIITKALSLSILKVISFGTLEKGMVRMLKQLFTDLLLEHSQAEVEAAFTRIAQIDKLKQLHEGLRLFLRHFLVGKKGDSKPEKLVEMVEIADRLLSRGKGHVLL